jgi:hypothetical protein
MLTTGGAGRETAAWGAAEKWYEEIAPTDALQALRQAATPSTPSGQHGQGSDSGAGGIMSAQGIPEDEEPVAAAIAEAMGADSRACPATSTYIRVRNKRRFIMRTICLARSDRNLLPGFLPLLGQFGGHLIGRLGRILV